MGCIREISVSCNGVAVRMARSLVVYTHIPPPKHIQNRLTFKPRDLPAQEDTDPLPEYDSKYIIKEYNKSIKEPTGFMRESKEMRLEPNIKVQVEQVMGYSGNLQMIEEGRVMYSVDNHLVLESTN